MPDFDFEKRVADSGAMINVKDAIADLKSLMISSSVENREILKSQIRMEMKQDEFKNDLNIISATNDAIGIRLTKAENIIAGDNSATYQKECDDERKDHGSRIAVIESFLKSVTRVITLICTLFGFAIMAYLEWLKH